MTIIVKNKETLTFDILLLNVCWKNGTTNEKIEGDKKYPKDYFLLVIFIMKRQKFKTNY